MIIRYNTVLKLNFTIWFSQSENSIFFLIQKFQNEHQLMKNCTNGPKMASSNKRDIICGQSLYNL